MSSTIKRVCLLLIAFGGLSLAVCGPRLYENYQKNGAGGSTTKSASGARLTALFGLLPKGRLGFLILAQFPTPGATTSASSRWEGSATHKSENGVTYAASLSDIEINKTTFDFNEGRVFFAQAKSGTVRIHQLEVEIQNLPYLDEIDRIAVAQAVEELIQ